MYVNCKYLYERSLYMHACVCKNARQEHTDTHNVPFIVYTIITDLSLGESNTETEKMHSQNRELNFFHVLCTNFNRRHRDSLNTLIPSQSFFILKLIIKIVTVQF